MTKQDASVWFEETELGEWCNSETHCENCKPDGDCDSCFTIDGRCVEAVSEYASTCDGDCMELTMHERLHMDPETQLGYCDDCLKKLPSEIRKRIKTPKMT